jgi:glycosidase
MFKVGFIKSLRIIAAVVLIISFVFLCLSCGKPELAALPWREAISAGLAKSPLPEYTRPEENGRTWYQVFVYSFCDSNGDGIGDLRGVTEQLDYIQNMGFDGIWLSPIHPSTTYHKYDIKDYYGIDKQYGTTEDFDALMTACNERGLKVLLDLVLNHTSDEHPWFTTHPEYYHIQAERGSGQWQAYPGGGYYECQFWGKMPDLDLSNTALRGEFEAIMRFWLDKGVFGFRLDAVKEFESGNTPVNVEILRWVNTTVKNIKPNAYLVGEDWDTTDGLYEYYESGIDSLFAYTFAGASGPLAKTLLNNSSTAADYLDKVEQSTQLLRAKGEDYATLAPFFTNHDNARALGFLKRDPYLIKTAWGMSLMQPGDAFVYYGEELGMAGSGKDENKRAPMYWTDNARAEGMSFGPPGMDTQQQVFAPAYEQVNDPNSIFSYVRTAVRLRAEFKEIGRGSFEVLPLTITSAQMTAIKISALPKDGVERKGTYLGEDQNGVVNFDFAAKKVGVVLRRTDDNWFLVIYNLSPATATLDIADISKLMPNINDLKPSIGLRAELSATGLEASYKDSILSVQPYSIVIVG